MVEYKIIRIVPLLDIDEMGRFYKKYRVYFKFNKHEDWVDISEDKFTTENVKKEVERKIKTILELMG